jgi:ELWxxDGT repeat protein
MKALRHRHSVWSRVCMLVAVLVALASVHPAQAAVVVRLVKDINTRMTNVPSDVGNLTAVDGMIYFVRIYFEDNPSGYASRSELWRSDGTLASTTLVTNIPVNPGCGHGCPGPFYARWFTAVGNTLFFVADDIVHGPELWKSDGTAAGTTLVRDINPTDWPEPPLHLTAVGSTLFFVADDGILGKELWKSDGTAAGTTIVRDINPTGWSEPHYLRAVGSTLFFAADDGVHGRELWKTDGTQAGTTLVKDINPSANLGSIYGELTAVGSTLFFIADDGVHERGLWKSDGTAAGTTLVKEIAPYDLTALGDILFFRTSGGLWKSDGTTDGTVLVSDIIPSSIDLDNLTAVGSTLFFTGLDVQYGRELWAAVDLPYSVYLPLARRKQ